MPNVTIYHNPRCSKSRQTLELIRAHGIEPNVIEYLKDPPSVAELRDIAKKLELSPKEMVRKKEFSQLQGNDDLTSRQYLQAMADHPRTIERPIVVCGNRARVGRPPENVLDLLT